MKKIKGSRIIKKEKIRSAISNVRLIDSVSFACVLEVICSWRSLLMLLSDLVLGCVLACQLSK